MKKFLLVFTMLLLACHSTHPKFISCKDINCLKCNGTGKLGVCSNCNGKGVVACINCDMPNDVCSECNGSGEKRCGEFSK